MYQIIEIIFDVSVKLMQAFPDNNNQLAKIMIYYKECNL